MAAVDPGLVADAAQEVLLAKQRIEIECHARDQAIAQLCDLLGMSERDSRVLVIGDLIYEVAQLNDVRTCKITRANLIVQIPVG